MQLDTPERQREFVTRLADHQLAGARVRDRVRPRRGPRRRSSKLARERDFPVFEVPYEVPFIAITEAAFTQLVNEQYAVLRRALAAQERLERIVLSERGLDALAGALAALIGAAVLVFDPRGELLVPACLPPADRPEPLAALQSRAARAGPAPRRARVHAPRRGGGRALALPVAADGRPAPAIRRRRRVPEAWLVAIKDSGPLSDFDRLTLHQAVTIVALELLRARVAGDTERRLAGDVLAAVVRGELDRRRARAPARAVRARLIAWRRSSSPARNGRGSPAPAELALAAALRDEAAPGLVASTGSLTCALVPGMDEEELFSLAERVAAAPAARSSTRRCTPASAARSPAVTLAAASTRPDARSRR